MSSTLKGCLAFTAVAALSGAAVAQNAVRPTIEDFPRGQEVMSLISVDDRTAATVWDNGPADIVTAHTAQDAGPAGFFQAADDFLIKAGFYAYVHEIEVCFLVSSSIEGQMCKPEVCLNIFDDCDGRPGSVIKTVSDSDLITAVNDGPSATFPGFNMWRFTFKVEEFYAGYQRLWVSPYGKADFGLDMDDCQGYYFWRSANNGTIQGVQGQLKNANDPWMDVQDCGCPDYCTDFCFTIRGHRCCLAKNNTPYDATGGASSLQLKGALIQTSRAVDNFQIGPYGVAEICRIEAWMATNCNTDKIFCEIYGNDCNMPSPTTPLFTIDDGDISDADEADGIRDYPIATDTGVDFAGCNIYHLVWPKIDPAVALTPGRDYWLSVVARGNGGIADKAFWMYLQDLACNINITEGKVRDPFVTDLEMFTFVSEAFSSNPRDFAFQLYTNDVGARSDDGSTSEGGDDEVSSAGGQISGTQADNVERKFRRLNAN